MSIADLSRALAAFDDRALATLANPGLLRRAQRDLESGKIALEGVEGAEARLAVDGQAVTIGAAGPAKASCDCPAVGTCRHVLGATLFLRDHAEPDGVDEEVEPTAPADPQEIIAAISAEDARKFAGRPGWRAAQELLAEVEAITPEANSISVRFAGLDEPVLILRGQGMAGIVSSAAKAKKKPYHAAAIIAARQHFGLPVDAAQVEESEAVAAGPLAPDPAFLARVKAALGDCARLGFNLAPEPLEETLFELSVSSRADALPRLASMLRGVAAQVRLKRQRAFAFDAGRMLELVATAHALASAAGHVSPDDPRFAKLAGQVRRDYEPLGDVDLIGLGAEVWWAQSGARGVTVHLLDEDAGRFYSVSMARGAGQDPTFEPRLAYRQQGVWQAGTLDRIAHARIRLTGGAVAADGRLSAARDVHAQVLENQAQPPLVGPAVHGDWDELHAHLVELAGLGIDATGAPQMVLLSPADTARPTFDELAQRLVWPLRDHAGRWLALTLDHDDRAATAIERLEKELRSGWKGMVLARAALAGDRLALTPVTLFGKGDPVDLTIAPPRFGQMQKESDLLGWLRRLRPVAGHSLALAQPSASEKAVSDAWRHILDRLEAGPQLARLLDDKRASHAARLTDFGMARLGQMLLESDEAGAALAAAYALLVARQQRTRLPLLA